MAPKLYSLGPWRIREGPRSSCALTSRRRSATPAPPRSPRVRFPAGAWRLWCRWRYAFGPGAGHGLLCPLVAARMPHLENVVLCRESQVSTLQSLFGEVLWSSCLFSSKSRRQRITWSCDSFQFLNFSLNWGAVDCVWVEIGDAPLLTQSNFWGVSWTVLAR